MKRWPLIITIILSVAYALYFSWFTIGRHHKTNSTRFDLGINEQVLWSTIHGNFLTMTDPYGTEQVSRLAFHADPILALIAPMYAIWPHTEFLLILQSVALASGGLATFFIARKLLHAGWWGVALSFVYVINPGLQWTNIFDFHAVALAIPLILWAAWFAIIKKWWPMVICAGLAMFCKEEIGLLLPVLGIYVLLKQQQKKLGWAMIIIPAIWSLVMFLIVLPAFRQSVPSTSQVYQSDFGNSAGDIIKQAVQHPGGFIKELVNPTGQTYAGQLVMSFGGLPLLSWWTLGAVPEYVINMLSNKPAQHLLISHYTSGLTPWLVLGSIMTTAWLIKHWPRKVPIVLLAIWLVGWGSYVAWTQGPLPGTSHDHSRVVTWKNVYAQPVAEWEKIIPASAKVSVTNNIGAHFARREFLYSFPNSVSQADYLVVLEGHQTPIVATQIEVSGALAILKTNPVWQEVYHQGDLTILKHR